MVKGINAAGESSVYVYNGLGALVENVWTIAKNAYGYHDVDAGNYTPLGDISTGSETNNGNGNGNGSGNTVGNNGNGNVKNPSTVVKQFVVDYTSETYEPLTEHEINGLDYRYVYGNDRLSVNITGVDTSSGNIVENGNQIRLYYHMDYLGTADYLTSPVSLKVTSWTHYNEWGEITHNAVLKCGMRELDMVKRYATHDYDNVLNMFYAKARFYDADNRRFASVDPVKGYVSDPASLVQYPYVKDNPLVYIDPDGNELVAALVVTAAVLAAPILADLTVKAAKSLSKGIEETMKPAASTPKVTTPNYSIPIVGSNSGGYIPPKQVAASAGAIAAVTAASAIAKGTGTSSSPNVSTTKPGTGASSGISLIPQQKPWIEQFPLPEERSMWVVPPLYYDDIKLPSIFGDPIPEPEKPNIVDLPTYDGPTITTTAHPLPPIEQEKYFPVFTCDEIKEETSQASGSPQANNEPARSYEEAKHTGQPAPNHQVLEGHGNISKADPYSSCDLYQNGELKQRRYFGANGTPELDIDYFHANGDGTHVFPHQHFWDDSLTPPRLPGVPFQ